MTTDAERRITASPLVSLARQINNLSYTDMMVLADNIASRLRAGGYTGQNCARALTRWASDAIKEDKERQEAKRGGE